MRCRCGVAPWLVPAALLAILILYQNFIAAEQWSSGERLGVPGVQELKQRLEKLEEQSKDVEDLRQEVEDLRHSLSKLDLAKNALPQEAPSNPAVSAVSAVPSDSSASSATSETSSKCNIFALWNYPRGPPMFIKKNLESWIHYAQGRCHFPWLINETNIRVFIPDLPAEYDRMPLDYDAAKSDVVRYALLYHHGGIYLDTDFLVAKDLSPILDRIDDHDLVSYTTFGQSCRKGTFSSNFLAGRKGSQVFGAVWEAQKRALADHCDDRLKVNEKKVCCPDDLQRRCHIPWAGIGENVAHPVLKKQLATKTSVRLYCFEGDDSFVPLNFLEVLQKHPQLKDAEKAFKKSGVRNPSDRIMYHLFASLGFGSNYDGPQLFDPSTYVGFLYRKSIGHFTEIPKDPLEDGPGFICASDGEVCRCKGKVFYGRRWENEERGIKAELKALLKKGHAMREVQGEVKCSVDVFGDPIFTIPKHCVCQPFKDPKDPKDPKVEQTQGQS